MSLCLWSINDRLGGGAGVAVPPLGGGWVADVIELAVRESLQIKELQEEAEEEALRAEARRGADW